MMLFKFFCLNVKDESRNSVFIYNTIINVIFKGATFILNFLTIPLLLKLLSNYNFGIWEISFTITSYALILNFGLGNSLRNIIALNLVNDKKTKINHLISITFLLSTFLSLAFLALGIILVFIFNSSVNNLSNEVFWFLVITVISFLINIVLSLSSSISNAFQKSYLIAVYSFIQSLIFIFSLIVIKYLDPKDTLILIGLSFNITMLLTNVLLGYHLFRKHLWLKIELPKRNKKKYALFVFETGKQFAMVQLATLFLFSADSIIIATVYTVNDVSAYAVINKIYFYIITIFSILLIQLWNSTTSAFASKDFNWINKIKYRLELLIIPVIIGIFLMNVYSEQLFELWVGKEIQINKNIVLFLGIYTVFHIWASIFVNILNGMGVLKQQINLYVLGNILLILSVFLIRYYNLSIEYFVLSKALIIIIIAFGMYQSYQNEMKKV